MNIRISLLLLALGMAAPAWAEITTVVRAVELSTSNLRVPTTPNGRLTFKPCAGICDAQYQSARLTPDTQFYVNNEATDFQGFRAAFFNLASGSEHYALVSFDAKSSTVTSVYIAD